MYTLHDDFYTRSEAEYFFEALLLQNGHVREKHGDSVFTRGALFRATIINVDLVHGFNDKNRIYARFLNIKGVDIDDVLEKGSGVRVPLLVRFEDMSVRKAGQYAIRDCLIAFTHRGISIRRQSTTCLLLFDHQMRQFVESGSSAAPPHTPQYVGTFL